MTAMPPGPPTPGYDADWGLPPDARDGVSATRRAAMLCWVTGGLMFGLSGCMAAVVGMLAAVPAGEIQRMSTEQGRTQQEVDAVLMIQQAAPVVAGVVALLFVIPAIVLVVLGFFVRRRSAGVIRTAQAITIGHAILMGIGLILGLSDALTTGNVCGLMMTLIINGGLIALLVWTWRSLGHALHRDDANDGSGGAGGGRGPWGRPSDPVVEPWNRHLSDRV